MDDITMMYLQACPRKEIKYIVIYIFILIQQVSLTFSIKHMTIKILNIV